MTTSPATPTEAAPVRLQTMPESKAPWRKTVGRFLRHRMALTGTLIMVGLLVYIVAGSLVFSEADANRAEPAMQRAAPSWEHPFGTDTTGRDLLARTIYGGQISLVIGLFAVVVSVTVGTFIGALTGYFGGLIDMALMRITEAMLSIPSLLLLLVLAKLFANEVGDLTVVGRTFSGSVVVIIMVIGLTSWMYLARIVRSSFLQIKEMEFVTAARAAGASNAWIIRQHVLPNAMAPIIVAATLGVAQSILREAYISFLGFGVRQPTASWGNIIQAAHKDFENAPWLWIFPGVLIVLTVMSINFIGDGLRDALDPRADKRV